MKRSLIFLIFILISSLTIGQTPGTHLKFVAGYPNFKFEPSEWDEVYNSAILRLEGDSLIEDIVLCDSMHFLYFLRYYYDYNNLTALVAQKANKYSPIAIKRYQLISVNTRTLDTAVMEVPALISEYGEQYKFFNQKLNVVYKNMHLNYAIKYVNFDIPAQSFKPDILYMLFDPIKQQLELSTSAYYRDMIANGSNSGAYLDNNVDILTLQSDTVNNLLRIPSSLKVDSVYPLVLPEKFKVPIFGGRIIINNPHVLVAYFYEYSDSVLTYRVLNKKKKEWSKLSMGTVKNGKLLMNNFDDWLVGCNRVKAGGYTSNGNIKYPGQEVWKQEGTRYGPSLFTILDKYEQFYAEGFLYLYNINTQKYVEWNTGQADSEVLLVKDEFVYYRKYDAIYKALIVNGEKLGEPELLVKDDRVPDIHWAFISGS